MDQQPFRPEQESSATMPTATATFPLHEIAQRINHHERELADLRKEYELRQTQLTSLTRRKEDLQTELDQVEAEIANIDQATVTKASSTPSPKSTSISTPTSKSATPKKPAAGAATSNGAAKANGKVSGERVSLPKLLVNIVAQAKKPVSIKDLVAGVISHKYPTKATNLHGMVENRVSDLVKTKALKRVANQSGVVVLGKAASQTESNEYQKVAAVKPASSSKSTGSDKKLSLKDALIQVLAKSSHPLQAQQLADKVIAAGYQTKSKDFKNVVWVIAGGMDNVENVKGEGYRLKAGKTAANKKKG